MRPAHLARSFETVYLPGRPGAAPHCTGRVFDGLSTRPLRVLQFNTLADGLAQNGSFSKTPKRALEWTYRAPLLVEEILNSRPDIVCLQEVNHYDDHFQPHLSEAGYEGVFLPKRTSPAERYGFKRDGCCIFYSRKRLQPAGESTGRYYRGELGPQPSQGYLICPLRDASTDSVIYVATTHLKAGHKPDNEQTRIRQAEQLLDGLAGVLRAHNGTPISLTNGCTSESYTMRRFPLILTGDFNTTENSEVFTLLRSCGLKSIWDWKSTNVDDKEKDTANEEIFTTWKFRTCDEGIETEVKRVIDYIWFSEDFHPVSRWTQLKEDEIGDTGLPSMTYPSDHLAICCDLAPNR